MTPPLVNKRKSLNKVETPRSAKKAKQENVTPLKANQQKTPAKNNVGSPQNKNSSGKKRKQGLPKTPELNMFSGIGDLNTSKKEANNTKKLNQTPADAKKNKQKANSPKKLNKTPTKAIENKQEEAQSENNESRRAKKKLARIARRVEARNKIKQLVIKLRAGDVDALRDIEEKIRVMESKETKSKNCIRKIRNYKKILKYKDTVDSPHQKKKVEAKKQQQKQKPKPLVVPVEKEESESDEEAEDESSTNMVDANDSDVQDDEEGEDEEDDEEGEDEEDDEEGEDEEEESEDAVNEVSAENDNDDNEVSVESDDDDDEDSAENDDNDEASDNEDDEEEEAEENKNKKTVSIKNKQNQQQNLKTKETNKFDKEKKSRYVVFVGNLPYTATQDELREHFKKAGSIVDIRIPTDATTKKPRGFAYIELPNEDSYQKALSLHHTSVGGRRINVLYTQGGKKNSENKKNEIRNKNFKLQGMRKQGLFKGSPKAGQNRSARRDKKKQFEKSNSG